MSFPPCPSCGGAVEFLGNEIEPDIIAYGTSRSEKARQQAILVIIQDLGGFKKDVFDENILEKAEELGIDKTKATETLCRMKHDGEVCCLGPNAVRIYSR